MRGSGGGSGRRQVGDQQGGAGDGRLEPVGADLHPLRPLDLLVVLVRAFHAELLERVRRQQRAHRGDERTTQTARHDGVAFLQPAVHQHDVDGRAEPFDDLHLEHRDLRLVDEDEPVAHQPAGLRDGRQDVEQVGNPLARDGRGRHQGNIASGVGVVPVERDVEALLVQGQGRGGHLLVELRPDVVLLRLQRSPDRAVRERLPVEEAVDLVERDDERRLPAFQQIDRLDRLRLVAVHQVDDEDGDIAEARAARAQVGEGLVARGVDDEQAREAQVERGAEVDLVSIVGI